MHHSMRSNMMKMLLLVSCTTWLPTTTVYALAFSFREEASISDFGGITSLASWTQRGSSTVQLFAGTKRGKLLHFQHEQRDRKLEFLGVIQDGDEFEASTKQPSLPIYSITSTPPSDSDSEPLQLQLFCGGGDRYVSVWRQRQDSSNHGTRAWTRAQCLGPHTGWVKDVLYDYRSDSLHSIGCNRIESWKSESRAKKSIFAHAATRSIESSFKDGATLSSDLLCLCASDEKHRYFYAGGVDGRIHRWSYDATTKRKDPLTSVRAHDGRINAMVYSPPSKLLFSAGHDGNVQCRRDANAATLNRVPDSQMTILGRNGSPARVTSLSVLHESREAVTLVLGTASGELACCEATFETGSVVLRKIAKVVQHDVKKGMTYSIVPLMPIEPSNSRPSFSYQLAIGHSHGLSLASVRT